MPRGGKREAGPGKRMGRPQKPKIELRATKGIASEVLNTLGHNYKGKALPSELEFWLVLLANDDKRLRFDVLKYLTDRRDGKPAQGVFVGDTRENRPDLDFGNLLVDPDPDGKSGKTRKPN